MTLSGVNGFYSSVIGHGTGTFEGFKYQTKEFNFTSQTLDVSWWILVVNAKILFQVSGKLVWCSVQNTVEWGRESKKNKKKTIKEPLWSFYYPLSSSVFSNPGQWQWNWKEKEVKMLGEKDIIWFLVQYEEVGEWYIHRRKITRIEEGEVLQAMPI